MHYVEVTDVKGQFWTPYGKNSPGLNFCSRRVSFTGLLEETPGQVWEFFQHWQKIPYIFKMCFSASLVLFVAMGSQWLQKNSKNKLFIGLERAHIAYYSALAGN